MRSIPMGRWVRATLMAAVMGSPVPAPALGQVPSDPVDEASRKPTLRVWTYITDPAHAARRDEAEYIAQGLLQTAGLRVDWRHCGHVADCASERKSAGDVTLILTRARRKTCGQTALDSA